MTDSLFLYEPDYILGLYLQGLPVWICDELYFQLKPTHKIQALIIGAVMV